MPVVQPCLYFNVSRQVMFLFRCLRLINEMIARRRLTVKMDRGNNRRAKPLRYRVPEFDRRKSQGLHRFTTGRVHNQSDASGWAMRPRLFWITRPGYTLLSLERTYPLAPLALYRLSIRSHEIFPFAANDADGGLVSLVGARRAVHAFSCRRFHTVFAVDIFAHADRR